MPPVDAWVLLAGDHTVWDPGGGEAGAELWTHLRLLFCLAFETLLLGGCRPGVHCCCHSSGAGDVLGAACYQIGLAECALIQAYIGRQWQWFRRLRHTVAKLLTCRYLHDAPCGDQARYPA